VFVLIWIAAWDYFGRPLVSIIGNAGCWILISLFVVPFALEKCFPTGPDAKSHILGTIYDFPTHLIWADSMVWLNKYFLEYVSRHRHD